MSLLESVFRSRFFSRRPKRPEDDPAELLARAESHYFQGNRFFELKLWDRAVAEWRRAAQLWHPAQAAPRPRRHFAHLRAALLVVLTAVVVHQMLFVFFPRNAFEMIMLGQGDNSNRGWWERFLDTGRPQMGSSHKMTVREWWARFKSRLEGQEKAEVARDRAVRPSVSKRWAELLRRYGRWGPLASWELDYAVISGNGLSRLGEYDSAIAVLEKEIGQERQPEKLADLYQGVANAHYYQGYHLQQGGTATYDLSQVRKAAAAYEKSTSNLARPLSHGNLGWMYFLLGDYEKAEDHSKRALAMSGDLHYVRLNLGLIYLAQHRLRESFESYLTVINRNPDREVFLGGITDLKELIRDRPGRHPFAYLMIGILSLKKGELGEAREFLSRFVSGPTQGSHWKNLAVQLLDEMSTAELER